MRGPSVPALKGRPKVNRRYAAEGLNSYELFSMIQAAQILTLEGPG